MIFLIFFKWVYNKSVMLRDSYIKINIDNYRYNINYLRNKTNKQMIGIIKANGYGAIDYKCASLLQKEGVKIFGVSSLSEALSLRKHGFKEEILILGYVNLAYLNIILKNDLSITTVSETFVKELVKKEIKGLKVHLKIDTGMNRIGLFDEEAKECLKLLKEKGALVEGIFTHYASSDEKDEEFTKRQYERFLKTVKSLDHDFKYIHTANTDASINFKDEISTHVRCGLGLLGYSSFKSDLRPCVSLYTTIVNLKRVKKGEGISYGQTYHLDKDAYIATLPIGYADGILRANKGRKVYVNGRYYPIVGNICMDQMMIEVDENCHLFDEVEIFGEHINIEEMAKDLGTISYEILTSLSDRLTREYVNAQGEIIDIYTPRFNEEEL